MEAVISDERWKGIHSTKVHNTYLTMIHRSVEIRIFSFSVFNLLNLLSQRSFLQVKHPWRPCLRLGEICQMMHLEKKAGNLQERIYLYKHCTISRINLTIWDNE